MAEVAVILGSKSDKDKMKPAFDMLKKYGIEVEVKIFSAHRTPNLLRLYVEEKSLAEVFIVGAGMAAALPGMVAAYTPKPVIGVPLSGSALNGTDALYAIVQMPPGIPVATVAIDGAKNAAILAMEILGKTKEILKMRAEMEGDIVKAGIELDWH